MTRHLHDAEFVDLIDGTLPAGRAGHLDECESCRAQADALKAAMVTADTTVPEPSPLFWEHFSARLRTAIAEEPVPQSTWRRWMVTPAARWSAVAAAVLVVVAAGIWRDAAPLPGAPATGERAAAGHGFLDGSDFTDPAIDLEADEAWAVVRTVADTLPEDEIDAAVIETRPGSVERAAISLSDVERVELATLIEREIKAGTRVPSS